MPRRCCQCIVAPFIGLARSRFERPEATRLAAQSPKLTPLSHSAGLCCTCATRSVPPPKAHSSRWSSCGMSPSGRCTAHGGGRGTSAGWEATASRTRPRRRCTTPPPPNQGLCHATYTHALCVWVHLFGNRVGSSLSASGHSAPCPPRVFRASRYAAAAPRGGSVRRPVGEGAAARCAHTHQQSGSRASSC